MNNTPHLLAPLCAVITLHAVHLMYQTESLLDRSPLSSSITLCSRLLWRIVLPTFRKSRRLEMTIYICRNLLPGRYVSTSTSTSSSLEVMWEQWTPKALHVHRPCLPSLQVLPAPELLPFVYTTCLYNRFTAAELHKLLQTASSSVEQSIRKGRQQCC